MLRGSGHFEASARWEARGAISTSVREAIFAFFMYCRGLNNQNSRGLNNQNSRGLNIQNRVLGFLVITIVPYSAY